MELFLLNSLFSYERKSLLQLMSVSHDPIFIVKASVKSCIQRDSRTMRAMLPQNKKCFQHLKKIKKDLSRRMDIS